MTFFSLFPYIIASSNIDKLTASKSFKLYLNKLKHMQRYVYRSQASNLEAKKFQIFINPH